MRGELCSIFYFSPCGRSKGLCFKALLETFPSPRVGEDSETWRCGAEPMVDLGEGYHDRDLEFGTNTADPSPRSVNAHFIREVDLSSPTRAEVKSTWRNPVRTHRMLMQSRLASRKAEDIVVKRHSKGPSMA